MKAKKETTLVTVLTGSHLYGNASATSDYDYKAICLPPLDELLLNTKITNRKEKPVGLKAGDKMIAGETETEYLPLQVFLNDFFEGQTYALEVAFAILGQDPPFKPNSSIAYNEKLTLTECIQLRECIEDLVDLYLTKNVQKMIGYAVAQSKMYGLKTERYTSLNAALRVIDTFCFKHAHNTFTAPESMKTLDFYSCIEGDNLVEQLCALPFVKRCEILNAEGGKKMAHGIDICGKQFPLTNRLSTIHTSITKSLSAYGTRVKEHEGQPTDWKALSHAIRITDQVLELCATGNLKFPRENASFLLDVKTGKITLDEATDYLNRSFARVDDVIATSKLQERTPELETSFRAWRIQVLRNFYGVE